MKNFTIIILLSLVAVISKAQNFSVPNMKSLECFLGQDKVSLDYCGSLYAVSAFSTYGVCVNEYYLEGSQNSVCGSLFQNGSYLAVKQNKGNGLEVRMIKKLKNNDFHYISQSISRNAPTITLNAVIRTYESGPLNPSYPYYPSYPNSGSDDQPGKKGFLQGWIDYLF